MSKYQKPGQYANNLFLKAVKSLQKGDALGAKKGLLKVAKLMPESAAVWYNLGLSNQYLGQHQRAVEAYQKSLEIMPNQIEGWVNIGISQIEIGRFSEAENAVEKALQINPSHPRALNLQGSMEAEKGEYQVARNKLNQSIRADPKNKDAKINLAKLELEQGNFEQAEQLVDLLQADGEDYKQTTELKIHILLRQCRNEDASFLILELKEKYPDDEAVLWLELTLKEAIRDYFEVITIAEKMLKYLPEEAALWNSLGGAFFQLDSVEKARACYAKAIRFDPNHAEYENNIGLAYASMGEKVSAERHYRRSIALNPQHAEAYRNIATMKRFDSMDDPDARKIEALWSQNDLQVPHSIRAAFALGKVYDDCSLYDEAFKVYQKGNALKFEESQTDLEAYLSHIDRIPRVFDSAPKTLSAKNVRPHPIFILGMPRSGTTLVEQIISRHTEIQACGELPCVEHTINRLEKRANPMRVYPNDFWNLAQDELDAESEQYLKWVKRIHRLDKPYFTDKMPFNFVHIWLIKSLFPGSPIIHCERHPLDVIISNYFQLYDSDISFVYQLEALTKYTIRYYRLMQHWHNLFDASIVRVRYEKLVSEPEPEAQRLIKAIGFDWQAACLKQNTTSTAVRTASIWQVRQGIYTRSKARWRYYESYLQDTISLLAAEGIVDTSGEWLV